ncbi:uncharacterized protein PAC_14910 [Phialocephala subalpina]|uniref:Uncharacterized protein n=1 Tax=Phialocephala subalpina TaxID=576137 RepID=A0A1L7XIZ2_9HELO|nr:uncharacterized protein PAC_14910 [Phialocephala subalpina]
MARVLAKKNVAKILRAAQSGDEVAEDAQGKLPDGHMGGKYGIEARQHVSANSQDLWIWNYTGSNELVLPKPNPTPSPAVLQQYFQVQAPQFSLDPKTINTFYPPAGSQDEGRILPHIVFNDPHLPWAREAGVGYDFLGNPIDPSHKPSIGGRNLVPWMAVVVFDPGELLLSPADAASIGLINSTDPATYDPTKDIKTPNSTVSTYIPTKLPSDGAYQMTIGDYFTKIPIHRIYYEAGYDGTTDPNPDPVSVIFPKKSMLEEIFGSKATPSIPTDPVELAKSDRRFEAQKLMAHVRHVNTMGFPDAGAEEEGYFSVVVSSRTGQVKNVRPTPQIVHLVSIEHYDSTIMNVKSPVKTLSGNERVGVVSLCSWMYTCIPEPADFVDTMKALAEKMQPLKPPKDALKAMLNSAGTSKARKAVQILHDRLDKSYTISRWRTATGEETAAFNRGPLVGAPTPIVPAQTQTTWPALSMTGKDYQIFDHDIGLMDVTYSSAWALGKLVAISDSPFNAALLRFRSLVWTNAASTTRMQINGISDASHVLSRATSAIDAAHRVNNDFNGTVARINSMSKDSVAPPLSHPDVAPIFSKALTQTIDRYTSDVTGETLYNDFNLSQAANADWELIHGWISDCLYLAHIPAHYLFPEPSWLRAQPDLNAPIVPNLPPEALRFFFIDHAWLDCFIDGALSCANHLEPDYDSTRIRIKEVYNYYLSNNIVGKEGLKPPVPRFGFILRSSVVKAIPDLKITVLCWLWDPKTGTYVLDGLDPKTPPRNPVQRLTKLDDFTIMCLLDCALEEIQEIKISQPPHQQRYAIGHGMVTTHDGVTYPELEVRMLYTDPNDAPEAPGDAGSWPPLPGPDSDPPGHEQPTEQTEINFWTESSRVINPIVIADTVRDALLSSQKYKGMYTDQVSNAALMGLELNDPCYALVIDRPAPAPSKTGFPVFTRQLWTGATPASVAAPLNPSGTLPPAPPLVNLSPPPGKAIKLPTASPPQRQTTPAIPLPRPPRLNSSAVITVPRSLATSTPGIGAISGPQFTLIFHVDYRPPPPTPRLMPNGVAYAPKDYLPTGTPYLYDIIIAIRRKHPQENPGHRLVDLSVEMPVTTSTTSTDKKAPEPLLPLLGYKGPGARMVRNPRFVPITYNTDDGATFGIKLIPRSGDAAATIALDDKGASSDASVRLAQCPVASTVRPFNVAVAAMDPKTGKGTGSTVGRRRGLVNLVLRETYIVPGGSGGFKQVLMITDGARPRQQEVPLQAVKKDEPDPGDTDWN